MITSIAFTVYPVSHMEWARAFYEHVLGLHVSYNYRDVWVEYDLGGSTFAITTKERAVSFVTEAFDTPVCRMAVIEDPDGNHITIHKRHA